MVAVTLDYFALFALEPRYAIDAGELDSAYRALATRCHPDRFLHADRARQSQALELAAAANEGYRTLKRPVLRARHLLGLKGVETGRAAAASASMLAEQMEWREELEDALAAGDMAGIDRLDGRVRLRAGHLRARLAAQLDVDGDYTGAARTVEGLFFVETLLAAISDAHARLEHG